MPSSDARASCAGGIVLNTVTGCWGDSWQWWCRAHRCGWDVAPGESQKRGDEPTICPLAAAVAAEREACAAIADGRRNGWRNVPSRDHTHGLLVGAREDEAGGIADAIRARSEADQ